MNPFDYPFRLNFVLVAYCASLLGQSSSTFAQNWQLTGAPSKFWNCVASSADGVKLVACDGFQIYNSTNSGQTWALSSAPIEVWDYLASSADGTRLVAVANNFLSGQIYSLQSTPPPSLSMTAAGTNNLVSWILPSSDLTLQQSLDLSSTNWTDVSDPVVVNLTNLQNEVVLNPTNSNAVYRLRSR